MEVDDAGGPGQAGELLWRFSLALYARPGVADALIRLQDRSGRDVNLILFALWLGAARTRLLDAAGLAAAAAKIAPLNSGVVRPLRQLRRELKGAAESDMQALRRRILAIELRAERAVQQRLADAITGQRPPAGMTSVAAAEANLAFYLSMEAGSAEASLLRHAIVELMRAG